MKKFVFGVMLSFALMSSTAWADVKVIATFSILGDIVKNIAGDKAELVTLVGSDGDAHTYEPTPQDSVRLSNADVIFANGLHFEHWLNDLYQSSGSKARLITVTDGVVTPRMLDNEEGEEDPHAWHNVEYVIGMATAVANTLGAVDPLNQAYYQEQANKYIEALISLNTWIETTVKELPVEKRKLITSHDTFGYFADKYGFLVVGSAVAAATTEAADPSAKQLSELIAVVKLSQVPVIFSENIKSPKLIEMLAKEANVRVAPALYTDALGEEGSQGDTYIKMMQYNVNTIVNSLKGM